MKRYDVKVTKETLMNKEVMAVYIDGGLDIAFGVDGKDYPNNVKKHLEYLKLLGYCVPEVKLPTKLTYTDEMRESDTLWQYEKEDIFLMMKHYNEIIDEARLYGFNCPVEIYEGNNEGCIDIFKNECHHRLCQLGEEEPIASFGYCKPLIKFIEEMINNELTEPTAEELLEKIQERLSDFVENDELDKAGLKEHIGGLVDNIREWFNS